MKRFAYTLIYMAIFGFLITIAANLMNRSDIGVLVFFSSCVLLAIGGIVALLLKFYKMSSGSSGSSGKSSAIRIAANAFIYFSFVGMIIGLITSIVHIHTIGREIQIFSILCLLIGLILAAFIPTKESRSIMNPDVYRLRIISKNVIIVAAICLVIGLLFKMLHYSGGEYLLIVGLVLYLVYFILRLYQLFTTKKRPVLNIKTIDIPSADLDQYLGTYYNDQMKMDITISKNDEGASLIAQATNQNSFPLSAIEKDIFNYDMAGIVMEFKPEEHKFILVQHGGYFPFIKKK